MATPSGCIKNNNGVLVLNAETGVPMRRIVATDEQHAVRWLLLCDGVLVTLTGDPQHSLPLHPPLEKQGDPDAGAHWHNARANDEIRTFFGRELAGWDAISGEKLWSFQEERIDPAKLAARDGRLFFYANNRYAGCLGVKDGKPIWKTEAPIKNPTRPYSIDWDLNNIITSRQNALVAANVYLIASQGHGQAQAFSATDGQLLWQWAAATHGMRTSDGQSRTAGAA